MDVYNQFRSVGQMVGLLAFEFSLEQAAGSAVLFVVTFGVTDEEVAES